MNEVSRFRRRQRRTLLGGAAAALLAVTGDPSDSGESGEPADPPTHDGETKRPRRTKPRTARRRTDVQASLEHRPSRQRRRYEQRQRARNKEVLGA